MDVDEALDILDGGEIKVYETPHGTKLSVTTPSGEDWHATGEELDAAKQVMDDYEDITSSVYNADSKDEIEDILSGAEVQEPWRVIGSVENIELSVEEARELS